MEHVNPEVPDKDRLDEDRLDEALAETDAQSTEDAAAAAVHQHDDERVDEWEDESFPASDPPSNY